MIRTVLKNLNKRKLIIMVMIWLYCFSLISAADVGLQDIKTAVKIGDFISFGTYNEKPIIWQVVRNDDEGLMLFSYDILDIKAFDANGDDGKGKYDYDSRENWGSNYWYTSNLREWLNSRSEKVYYTKQAPNAEHVQYYYNNLGKKVYFNYEGEKGFLCNFTENELEILLPNLHKVWLAETDIAANNGGNMLWNQSLPLDQEAYYQWVEDYVFIPSFEELMTWVRPYERLGGTLYSTSPAFTIEGFNQPFNSYWLRNPSVKTVDEIFTMQNSDLLLPMNACYASGVRPMIRINPKQGMSGVGSLSNPYVLSDKNVLIDQSDHITIEINGKPLNSEMQPVIDNGSTLVPLKAIFDALGLNVQWFGDEQKIIGTKDQTKIELKINQTRATVNGTAVTMSTPPRIINGSTYVPVKFIAESTGYDVLWDGSLRRIQIISAEKERTETESIEFYLDAADEVTLHVGETITIQATVKGDSLSFEEMYPKWHLNHLDVSDFAVTPISGYTNSEYGIVKERVVITAEQAVNIVGKSVGQSELYAVISYGNNGEPTGKEQQIKTIINVIK